MGRPISPISPIHLARGARIILLWLALASPLFAQQKRDPHIGYIFPASGERGTVCECVIGGQFLDGVTELYLSGSGVVATIDQFDKPLPPKRLNELRDYVEDARKKAIASGTLPPGLRGLDAPERITLILKETGATAQEIKQFLKQRKDRNDPKRQPNLQLAETVTVKIGIAPDAQPGPRELRLLTPASPAWLPPRGLSNPLTFFVGTLPEQRDDSAREATRATAQQVSLPVVLNGQILPGAVDRFTFKARQGAHLVIAVQARDMIPYFADAVPGWFQAIAVLSDAKGKEVAYGDSYRFSPDPVFCYDVPVDGDYSLEIRDALYRGREDFVFRVTAGEIPFITSIFPLGGRTGVPTKVTETGWNLAGKRAVVAPAAAEGVEAPAGLGNGLATVDPLFAIDSLPACMKDPDTKPGQAQEVTLPVVINGRINPAGDVDRYVFSSPSGAKIVAEVNARRLNSPLDSWLKVTDAAGRQLAFNDDWEDKSAGLLTHQADSYLTFTTPARGRYYVQIGDAQGKGGPEFGYRLRISAPRPDFALRIVPSCVNAFPNATAPVTVYALRKDGFAGDIALALRDAPPGMVLDGGVIPAGQDKVRATLTVPQGPAWQPLKLAMEGHATIEGRDVIRQAVAAEDMTQAFVIHHLVAENDFLAVVTGSDHSRAPLGVVSQGPMKLPAGGVAQTVLSSPLRRFPYILTETKMELSEPPAGIAVEGISATLDGVAITFQADAKIKPGLRGNLIVEAFRETTPAPGPNGKTPEKQRRSVGFLPAIPFEVTGP